MLQNIGEAKCLKSLDPGASTVSAQFEENADHGKNSLGQGQHLDGFFDSAGPGAESSAARPAVPVCADRARRPAPVQAIAATSGGAVRTCSGDSVIPIMTQTSGVASSRLLFSFG